MMFVDHDVGNTAAKIKSLNLNPVLEWLCLFTISTHAHKLMEKLMTNKAFVNDKSLACCIAKHSTLASHSL